MRAPPQPRAPVGRVPRRPHRHRDPRSVHRPSGWPPRVVPLASSYRPLWVALGVISVDLVLAIIVTSLLRERIGQRTWRAVHWARLRRVAARGRSTRSTPAATRLAPWMLAVDRRVRRRGRGRASSGGSSRPRLEPEPARGRDRRHRPIRSRSTAWARSSTDGAAPLRRTAARDRRRAVRRPLRPARARCRVGAAAPGRSRPSRRAACSAGAAPGSRSGASGDRSPSAATARRRSSSSTAPRASRSAPRTGRCCRLRPHLVLDGALLAADAVGADERIAVLRRLGASRRAASPSGQQAAPRAAPTSRCRIELFVAPDRLRRRRGDRPRSTSSTTADARPTTTPPRPYERGIGGRPTLVQNVESLAYAALIAPARRGWYREPRPSRDAGHRARDRERVGPTTGVREIEIGTTVGELARMTGAGRSAGRPQAVLLGGYFGGWLDDGARLERPARPDRLRQRGLRRSAPASSRSSGNDSLRRPGDGPDHGLHGRPERRPVRAVRVRPAGDRGRDGPARRAAGPSATTSSGSSAGPASSPVAAPAATPTAPSASSASSLRVFGPEWELHQRAGACSRERRGRPAVGGPRRRVA